MLMLGGLAVDGIVRPVRHCSSCEANEMDGFCAFIRHLRRGRLNFRPLVCVRSCVRLQRTRCTVLQPRASAVELSGSFVRPCSHSGVDRVGVMRPLDVAVMSSLQRHCNWQQGPSFPPRRVSWRESCSSGLACLEYEEQLSMAMQRSFALLTHAHARTADAGRVLQALSLFEIFRGDGRAALAALIAPWLRYNTCSTSRLKSASLEASFLVEPLLCSTPMPHLLFEPPRMVTPRGPPHPVPRANVEILHVWYAVGRPHGNDRCSTARQT